MAYAAVLLFCVLDHLFSFRAISLGGKELNPVMQQVMAQPFWISFALKNTWTACLLVVLFLLGKKAPGIVMAGLIVTIVIYGFLTVYHLFLFLFF